MRRLDVVVVGAGPAGLCFARALAGNGLQVGLVEVQPRQALAEAAFDGREIALTHASRQSMEQMGLWQRLPHAEIADLRDARVMNGGSPFALMKAEQRRFYFDQSGTLTTKFGVRAVPAVIEQAGRTLKVSEIAIPIAKEGGK